MTCKHCNQVAIYKTWTFWPESQKHHIYIKLEYGLLPKFVYEVLLLTLHHISVWSLLLQDSTIAIYMQLQCALSVSQGHNIPTCIYEHLVFGCTCLLWCQNEIVCYLEWSVTFFAFTDSLSIYNSDNSEAGVLDWNLV